MTPRTHVLVSILALALALSACGGADDPQVVPQGKAVGAPGADATGDAGVIVYRTNRDVDYEIYRIRPDGTDLSRLTNSAGLDAEPALSLDGAMLAFTSARSGGRQQVFLANAIDGSNPRKILLYAGSLMLAPSFGVGDGPILFFTHQSYDWTLDTIFYREDANGGASATAMLGWNRSGSYTDAVMSPDGARLAFCVSYGSTQNIYVRDVVYPGGRSITSNGARNCLPSWDPSGTQIAYQSNVDGRLQVYVMDVDGGNVRRITDNTSDDGHPSWSPDGSRIAFHSDRSGDWDVWMVDVDGNNRVNVTNSPSSSDKEPHWGPSPK